jgi:hypothetical protein|uniref:hypothetical protein n=1 Tax=Candidatus Cryptobacteroides bacterium TaxID=3085639 RepID=UPI0040271FD8
MRRFIQILALAIAGLLLTTDALGQAQITTRREKLKDFTSKTTKVVLTGDEFLDEAVKESVAATWTVSPYEFCSNEEFQNLKGNADFYFLMVVKGQFRRESEPGIDMLTLVKGGEGADKSINDMFEVVSFPLRSTEDPSGREFVLLPAFLKIIQEHTTSLTDTEMKAYSNIGAKDSKRLRIKRIFFWAEDFAPQVDEQTKRSLDEDILIKEDEDEVDEIFSEGTFNTVVSYVVAPSEPVNGSICYKMLIGSDNHELYYFKKHKITAKSGKGFLSSDIKSIKLLRK